MQTHTYTDTYKNQTQTKKQAVMQICRILWAAAHILEFTPGDQNWCPFNLFPEEQPQGITPCHRSSPCHGRAGSFTQAPPPGNTVPLWTPWRMAQGQPECRGHFSLVNCYRTFLSTAPKQSRNSYEITE